MDTHVKNQYAVGVVLAKTKRDIEAFVKFPFRIYENHACWVPPLIRDEVRYLWENPARADFEIGYFLAKRANKVVGRIAVFCRKNDPHNQTMKFGWLDFEEDVAIAQALLERAAAWGRNLQKKWMRGPYGFSSLDRLGILTHGFDEIGTYSSNYNYAYYAPIMRKLGFEQEKVWVEYELEVPTQVPDRVQQLSAYLQRRGSYSLITCKNRRELAQYKQKVFELLQKTYTEIPSFEQLSPAQVSYYIRKNFKYIQPGYVSIAQDQQGEIVGFAITAPSISEALIQHRGKLSLSGMYARYKAMRQNHRADFYLIAILPEHRAKGIPVLFIEEILKNFIEKGIRRVETNPELESNYKVQMLWKFFAKRQHKSRCTFQKRIDGPA